MSTPKPAPQPTPRVTDVEVALAEIEKGQQLAGHFPDAEALDRARRYLAGEITSEEGRAELAAKYHNE